ncbi:MAG: HAMP domain-containing histidine kinase, partial [Propionibacterium sp.]|nr:HAMP domain-containing histidine kinase [Propionibacterium sp.]
MKTLASQIQFRVGITVAVMATLLAGLTLVVAQNLLVNQLDNDIDSIPLRVQGSGPSVRNPGIPRGTVIIGQAEGTVFASIVGAGDVNRIEEGVAALLELDPGRHTVTITNLGGYRLLVERGPGDGVLVVGLPTRGVDETMAWLTVSAIGIALLSVIGTLLVTRTLIARATRPLKSLTTTAATVSELPLERGTVEVPRVDIEGLPPEHEVAQVGSAFNHMLDNVEGALVARESSEGKLRRFVADASHELRNPLAAIHGYSQLAEQHAPELDDDTAHALGRISSESERMTKLVGDMMMLARLDADMQPSPEAIDAVEVTLNATSDARASAPEHVWRIAAPDEPVTVLAGADQLQQIMLNLLGNAANHTPPGTTVEVEVAPSGTITVTDDGPGIAPEVLPHVFERFARADGARRHSESHATGLGLAIVKAHVESFGGSVEVESRPG